MIPYYLVDAVIHAPFGSHPGEMCYAYERDEPHIKSWVEASKDLENTQAYLQKYIYDLKDHQEYLDLVGKKRLKELQAMVPKV
jgi:3-oxoacid CoA-transferase subunit A/glutaconate CoA-transferase subunit A